LVLTIILIQSAFFFVFCFAFGSLGLQRASAQIVPAAPQVPSAGAVPTANGASKPTGTKVVRIYNGAGYFDDVLADKLRPMLAKAFPFSRPEPPKAVAGATVAAPTKPENQKKIAEAAHL
jgi:hypothetical protein